ncbi:hypothetical protein MKS88_005651 [Plasmodium brasilianum]|uniref:Uncharacterized protein n=2 Tax=Plasmodium (Plasmodium) TaxID=418103 RepID=A0A1A8WGN5_PLAMA|nr:conserved Plasmodium protein, unknown function [Plasmodium malariae]KAI4834970.1 hypothetical protein MKS88_005651 [Plasmodium brasilianum]SBS90964.1 conserved Plasmodium protein, unknown function [Plasmodium malariae]SCP03542.1 conserved Plasmodium protein, unknown function [Plasmodium malariae]
MTINNKKRNKGKRKNSRKYICVFLVLLSYLFKTNECVIPNERISQLNVFAKTNRGVKILKFCKKVGTDKHYLFKCSDKREGGKLARKEKGRRSRSGRSRSRGKGKKDNPALFVRNLYNKGMKRERAHNYIKADVRKLSTRDDVTPNRCLGVGEQSNYTANACYMHDKWDTRDILSKNEDLSGVVHNDENNDKHTVGEELLTNSVELIKHIKFNFEEECKDIMVRLGNFLEVSPHLLFKDVCVNLNKLYTNLYTYDHENIPFGNTEHTLNLTDDIIKHNKFKIYCVLGLKVLRIFLIKYLRSIRLCIPVEVRKRYIIDFLKIDYISKIYDKKYDLIDYNIYNRISDKLKTKLIYFYLALKPHDVPNVLIKIFKAANYKDENELIYKYIKNSKFTSRGGKRFYKNISKEYIKLFEKEKLIKKHSCEDNILWQRFFSLLKQHNEEIAGSQKIMKHTYRLIFSKINFANDHLLRIFRAKGFHIFDHYEGSQKGRLTVENEVTSNGLSSNELEMGEEEATNGQAVPDSPMKQKLTIGHKREMCVINYINNLKKFIINYIERNKSIYHSFYLLKKNVDTPKNVYYDDMISRNTNIFHFTNSQNSKDIEKREDIQSGGNSHVSNNTMDEDYSNTHISSLDQGEKESRTIKEHDKDISKNDMEEKPREDNVLKQTNAQWKHVPYQKDANLYCDEIINNTIDNILDIMIEGAGFKNIKTLFGIYNSLKSNKDFKLIHFKDKF